MTHPGHFFWKLHSEFLSEDVDEKKSEEESDESATNNFTDPVTDTFLETGKIVLIEIELVNEHIEIASLIS